MLTAERRKEILRLTQQQGVVHVSDLSQRFHVSLSTIRRDLEWLADQGKLERTYGGAVIAPASTKAVSNGDEVARRIGHAAAEQVASGETVFIGPGPLCRAAARCLGQRADVTVITNGLGVAWVLHQNGAAPFVVTGGAAQRPGGALIGHLALNALETLRADRLIVEAAGVSPLEGLTSDQLPLADVLRPLLKSVTQVVVLIDAERLGRRGAAWLGPVSEADVIITEREADPALVWDLSESGVKVTLV